MSKADFTPRPSQVRVLEYSGGKMGVSAVPGSGKTTTLSALAAKLVRESNLQRGQQILIVTLVNSARSKFDQTVRSFLGEGNLGTLYRVRTLHGLANDIVSERPGLVGLSDDFQIVDEFEAKAIITDAVAAWFNARRDFGVEEYLSPDHQAKDKSRWLWREKATDITLEVIQKAKDFRWRPGELHDALTAATQSLPLAEMCVNVYESYQRALQYRGGVDFQDLIRLALDVLEASPDYLATLQRRWPFILEDEAQDSSQLQEQILRKLAGEAGNWVRVGDPNQAIYETFTTASPEYLRRFLTEPGVTACELPESGRSAQRIMDAANHLIRWSLKHPNSLIRARQPLAPPFIKAADNNPPDADNNVKFMFDERRSSDKEREDVAKSVRAWLQKNPESTVALLLPTNANGAKMGELLQAQQIPHVEVLRTTTSTREVARTLHHIADFLAFPTDAGKLGKAFVAFMRDERESAEAVEIANQLKKLKHVEQFTAPRDKDWLLDARNSSSEPERFALLEQFRTCVQRWQNAALLPIDQLVLTISSDLFKEPAEIATAYSIAIHLRGFVETNPEFRLPDCVVELGQIVRNNRKFTGLGEDDDQFDPTSYKGQAVIITHHKAKGLEWDRVYLMSVNNYDFPSADANDQFQSESYFARDNLNLSAEALAQLKALKTGDAYREGEATEQARIEYCSERLRLLYVGITRAKRELIVTWNTGKKADLFAARPLAYLNAAINGGDDDVR
ncbi:MAG: ATP-dependent helicase [Acidobacteriota bacterium]|nr:ATP-dependent helicase [Acidobacteriota bacterium]